MTHATIFLQGMNMENVSHTLDTELNKVYNWITSNRLTLNTNKSHFMISSPFMTPPIRGIIMINNLEINEIHEFNFWGGNSHR